ncbi:MAG: hypothetical protein JW878_05805 [Methanomicrobia archaeon]|nr:hypothetical protein [Methanomicrobia archaeon]
MKLEKIHLEGYYSDFDILNRARVGLIHFSPEKLKDATKKILDDSNQFYHVPINNLEDWSRFAYFSYTVMWQITSELYGESQRLIYLKEGLEDYRNKKQLRGGRHET